jgi:hypothetical protein
MEEHAEILIGKPWHQRIPGWRDVIAVLLVVSVLMLLGLGGRQMARPFAETQRSSISLSPGGPPRLRTPHNDAHARCPGRVADLHFHLCNRRC